MDVIDYKLDRILSSMEKIKRGFAYNELIKFIDNEGVEVKNIEEIEGIGCGVFLLTDIGGRRASVGYKYDDSEY